MKLFRYVYRSAKTGKYVTPAYALNNVDQAL